MMPLFRKSWESCPFPVLVRIVAFQSSTDRMDLCMSGVDTVFISTCDYSQLNGAQNYD